MELNCITPLILTYNESPNIGETLDRLRWAQRIVVIDSFSSDDTLEIAKSFSNVVIYQRPFDHFAGQCNFGLAQIDTEWTLSLDADYKCPQELQNELESLDAAAANGFWASFRYCINGMALRGTLYPNRLVLYRTGVATYHRDGHAHRVHVQPPFGRIKTAVLHDDRKPLSRWLASQVMYAKLEAVKLRNSPPAELGWKDRLRRYYFLAPFLTFVYCLFFKRLILDGRAGIHYTLQRVYAEVLLSLELIDQKMQPKQDASEATSSVLPSEPAIVASAKSLSQNRLREGDSPIFPRGLGKIGTVPDGSER